MSLSALDLERSCLKPFLLLAELLVHSYLLEVAVLVAVVALFERALGHLGVLTCLSTLVGFR